MKHLLGLKGNGPRTWRQSQQFVCRQELVWAFWDVGEEGWVGWAAFPEKVREDLGPEPQLGVWAPLEMG